MAKLENTILLLGEGPTEKFYLESLKDEFPLLQNIKPDYPKHTSMRELEKAIDKGIKLGYSKIYCLIDMDNKQDGENKNQYINLRQKYTLSESNIGACEVRFFETHRCIEQFFLFYFQYSIKEYNHSDDLKKELHNLCDYQNTQRFFVSHPLHPYFTEKGGSLQKAINFAEKSCKTKIEECRAYSYSQLGELMRLLQIEAE